MKINKNYKRRRGEYKANVLSDKAPFAIRESFGALRTNLLYTSSDGERSSIFAITSDLEASGKSMIISNIAISFAQIGKKVLLVDADMRCPVIENYFNYDAERTGLSEYLSGQVHNREEYIYPSEYESLDILGSGKIPPNPSDLVLNPRFSELLEGLKAEYDYILVDFPPIGVCSDAVAISKIVTGYIMVVRSEYSKEPSTIAAIQALRSVEGNIVGVVLNDVNAKRGGRYGYYRSGYNYYHKYNRQG